MTIRLSLVASLLLLSASCIGSQTGYDLTRDTVRSRASIPVPDAADAAALRAELLAKPLDADAAARLAVANSAAIDVAFSNVGIARGDLIHALRLPNPRGEFNAHLHSTGGPDLGFTATIDLMDLLLIPARAGAAEKNLDAAALDAAGALLDRAFEARASFYEYQAAVQGLELRKTIAYAAAQAFQIATQLFEAGNIPELKLLNEQVAYEEARVALARAEVEEVARREQLNELMGLYGEEAQSWKTAGKLQEPSTFDVANIEERAITASLDLEALRLRFGALAVQRDLAWVEGFLPDIEVGVAVEKEDAETSWGYGPLVGVTVPLFYQGQGKVEALDAQLRQAKGGALMTAIRLRATARTLGTQLQNAEKTAAFYRTTLLPLRERIVSATLEQYNAMNTGPFQVLSAKRDQIQTEQAYVQVVRDYWVTRARVELLLAGRLPAMAITLSSNQPVSGSTNEAGH